MKRPDMNKRPQREGASFYARRLGQSDTPGWADSGHKLLQVPLSSVFVGPRPIWGPGHDVGYLLGLYV